MTNDPIQNPKSKIQNPLAEPFSQIFVDRAEANWAFDLLCQTIQQLRASDPYDQRLAVTLTRSGGRPALRLNFGPWLVLGFRGPRGQSPERVDLALLAEQVTWDERFAGLPFEAKEGQPEIRVYRLPTAMVDPMPSPLRQAYEATLDVIAAKFQNRRKSTHWKQHKPEIIDACSDPDKRERLFAGELVDPELLYGRTYRPELEVAEEEEVYGSMEVWEQGSGGAEEQGGMEEAYGMEETEWEQGSRGVGEQGRVDESSHFSEEAFLLLAGLSQTPTKEFYLSRREEFRVYLEKPFQQLFQQIAAQFPAPITDLMETQKQLFARILKNDYGQGGAWDFYWGAFYPKGSKRTENAQLAVWLNGERIDFGFHIGDYGTMARERFRQNCRNNAELLIYLFQDILSDKDVIFGQHGDVILQPDGSVVSKLDLTWEEWLRNPDKTNCDLWVVLPKVQVLQYTLEQLAAKIAQKFSQLFPIILLAIHTDPLPEIHNYLGISASSIPSSPAPLLPRSPAPYPEFVEGPPSPAPLPPRSSAPLPPYALSQLAEDTGLPETELSRWLRALERKRQIILYGPPGTGKTYVAERLARHLVGGSDGFIELVQFHPAYAYEDFIQGLRPRAVEGGLEYPLVPGRFLEFCRQATGRKGACVLIVDEINRADLARVFGELMYLLEYRDRAIPLAGGGQSFQIPGNVRLIGTMNTADRSIALVDHALRRRFAFLALRPNYDLLRHYHQREATGVEVESLIKLLQRLNRAIGDPHYEVGVTFFLTPTLPTDLADIWRMEIEPYLEEYFFDQPAQVDAFRWGQVKTEILG